MLAGIKSCILETVMKRPMLFLLIPPLLCMSLAAQAGDVGGQSPVPAGAKWIFHLDWQRVLESEVGSVVKQYSALPMAEIQAHFGVNLFADIESLSFFGKDASEENSVCAVTGKFDVQRLNALARTASQHTERVYSGQIVHQWKERYRNRGSVGCAVNEHLILLGNTEPAICQCLDTLGGKSAASTLAAADNPNGLWYCSVRDLQSLQGADPKAAILQQITELKVGIDSKEKELVLGLEARTINETAAHNVKSITEGLRALALLNRKQDPHGADLAEKVQVQTEGAMVRLSMSVPAQAFAAWLRDRCREKETLSSAAPVPVLPAAVHQDKK